MQRPLPPHTPIHNPTRMPKPPTTNTLLTLSAASIGALSLALFSPRSPLNYRTMASSTSPTTASSSFTVRPYTPRHKSFPYTPADLTPMDPSSDIDFYSSPRLVTHIDDHAIGLLRQYYGSVFPAPVTSREGRRPRILDLCSSWVSHYPISLEAAAKSEASPGVETGYLFAGLGMNAPELRANPLFGEKDPQARWAVKDLNAEPVIPSIAELYHDDTATDGGEAGIDTTTLTVSIDYLTSPLSILSSLLARTKPRGTVHLAVSNRCFPSKAVGRWLRVDEEERVQMVGDYLWGAGWREVEIVQLSDGRVEEAKGEKQEDGALRGFMGMMGLGGGRCDPLWVVRGRKVEEGGGGGVGSKV